jgi:hypothetical protein
MRQQLLLHDPVALTIARRLTALGHDVRLIPAHYLKGHKNDYRDAEAIAEGAAYVPQRPNPGMTKMVQPVPHWIQLFLTKPSPGRHIHLSLNQDGS